MRKAFRYNAGREQRSLNVAIQEHLCKHWPIIWSLSAPSSVYQSTAMWNNFSVMLHTRSGIKKFCLVGWQKSTKDESTETDIVEENVPVGFVDIDIVTACLTANQIWTLHRIIWLHYNLKTHCRDIWINLHSRTSELVQPKRPKHRHDSRYPSGTCSTSHVAMSISITARF